MWLLIKHIELHTCMPIICISCRLLPVWRSMELWSSWQPKEMAGCKTREFKKQKDTVGCQTAMSKAIVWIFWPLFYRFHDDLILFPFVYCSVFTWQSSSSFTLLDSSSTHWAWLPTLHVPYYWVYHISKSLLNLLSFLSWHKKATTLLDGV